jgi:multiple sugar transport system substrate-binding protein
VTNRSLRERPRHRVALLAGVALCVGTFIGGTSALTAAQTPEPINVLTLGEGIFGAPFVGLADEFTAETGIPVNMITMGYDEEILKTNAAFAAKSDEYDVIQADSAYVKGYAEAGHIVPLDGEGLITAAELDDYFSDVTPVIKGMYEYDGHPVALGTIGNSQKFIFNKAALDDVGLAVPTTWDELLTAAQKIQAAGKTAGFTAGLERLMKATGVWLPIFISNGGELFDANMCPTINSQQGYDALTYLLELVKTMPPGGAAYTESDEVKSMATGVASLDPVAWIPDGYTTATPEIQSQIGFAVSPSGSVRAAPVMGGLGLTVSAYSKHKEDAARYVAWFNSKKVQSDMIVQNGGQPVRTSAWAANADAKPWFAAAAANLATAYVRPQIPEWAQIDTAIGTAMGQALAGELTVQQAIDQAQSQVDSLMKDAGYCQ